MLAFCRLTAHHSLNALSGISTPLKVKLYSALFYEYILCTRHGESLHMQAKAAADLDQARVPDYGSRPVRQVTSVSTAPCCLPGSKIVSPHRLQPDSLLALCCVGCPGCEHTDGRVCTDRGVPRRGRGSDGGGRPAGQRPRSDRLLRLLLHLNGCVHVERHLWALAVS